ncbi:MAG: TetR/AcrR family transcriptional regulator [Enterococcus sp.]
MKVTGGALKLRDALVRLLRTKAYSEISIKDIAKEAEMNRTSFYLFFENKEELARFTSELFLETYSENLVKSYDLYPNEENNKNIQNAFRYIDKQKEVIRALWSIENLSFSPYLLMQNSIEYHIENYLRKQQHPSIDTDMISFYSKLYAVNAMTTVKWWIETIPHPSYEKTADLIDTCCTKGLNYLLLEPNSK